MSGKGKSNYVQVLKALEELCKNYPNEALGKHIATALSDYGDFWGITDKEFLFALQKYRTERELDFIPESPKNLDKIINEGMNLDKILDEEEGEDEDGY